MGLWKKSAADRADRSGIRLSYNDRVALRRLPPWHRKRIGRTFLSVRLVAIAVILTVGFMGVGSLFKNAVGNRIQTVSATDALNRQDEIQEEQDVKYVPGKKVETPSGDGGSSSVKGSTNILLVGVDSRDGKNGDVGAGSSSDVSGTRTDSIMFLHLPDSGKPTVISFPRDLNVNRQACVRWSNGKYSGPEDTVEPRTDVKINSLYTVGGPRCLVRSIQELTGMKVDKFVAVDFAGFEDIVNALGGVDVQVDKPIIDKQLGPIVKKPGQVHMNGKKALRFVRARKVEGEGMSDYDRINRQQQFGMAVLNKAAQGSTLSNPAKLDALSRAIYGAVSGEGISSDFILSMLKRAGEFAGEGVDMHTIPTTGTLDNGNEGVDVAAKDQLMAQINT